MGKEIRKRELAQQILNFVGGEQNVNSVVHCATRLRFKILDRTKVDKEKIEALNGVVSVVESGGQFQVVIGNTVQYVYRELLEISNLGKKNEEDNVNDKGKKGNAFDKIIDNVSAIFTPILGAMIGSGIIKGLLMIGTMYCGLSTDSGTYRVLAAASNAVFYFIPIILAYTAAKKFKANPIIAMVIAGALVYPDMISAFANGEELRFLGVPIIMINYSSSVIPSLLAVWVLARLERMLEKVIPDVVKSFIIPVISIAVVVPITYLIIGPIGNYVGVGIANIYSSIYSMSPIVAGLLLGGFYQTFVIFGVHWALAPIQINNVAIYGFDTITAMYLPAKYAQAGATLAIGLRTKNKKLKSEAFTTAATTAIFGITEPAVYGFTLKYKKPFICASIAGAVGGCISGAFRSAAGAYGVSNTLTLPVFIGHGFVGIIIAIITSFILSTILTYLFGYKDEVKEEKLESEYSNINIDEIMYAPLEGNIKKLSEVSDEAFASEAIGKTIAVYPTVGTIVAPFNGVIEAILPSKHAIGLKSDKGLEVLIHVGIDTVELNGKGFEVNFEVGDRVKKGDCLIKFDIEEIKSQGYDPTTFVVVTNRENYSDFKVNKNKNIDINKELLIATR